jgi:hypothetical protein
MQQQNGRGVTNRANPSFPNNNATVISRTFSIGNQPPNVSGFPMTGQPTPTIHVIPSLGGPTVPQAAYFVATGDFSGGTALQMSSGRAPAQSTATVVGGVSTSSDYFQQQQQQAISNAPRQRV